MKLQRAFFLVIALLFLVGFSITVSDGKNQTAQVGSAGTNSVAITAPASLTVLAPGQTVPMTCSVTTAPGEVVYHLTFTSWSTVTGVVTFSDQLGLSYTDGSYTQNVTIPANASGQISLQCVAYYANYSTQMYTESTSNRYFDIGTTPPPSGDTTAPVAPTALLTSGVTSSSMVLSWTPSVSTDDVAVEVYRNGGTNTSPYTLVATVSVAQSSYTNNGLLSSRNYKFKLKARDAAGNVSAYSAIKATATSAVATPVFPTPAVILPTNASLTPNWNLSSASNAFSYNVYANAGGSTSINTSQPINLTPILVSSLPQTGCPSGKVCFTHQGLASGTTYKYKVRFYDDANNFSSLSAQASGTTITGAPATPSAPSGLAVSATSATWTDASSNETGFTLERATNSTFTTGLTTISSTIAANATSTAVSTSGLTAGATYYFRIKAVNASGSSAWSSTATFVVPQNIPAAPSNFNVASTGLTTASATWTDNANNETGFTLERATNSTFTSGPTTISSTIAANTASYSVTGLTAGSTYYFRVKANATTPSAWTTFGPLTMPVAPDTTAPTGGPITITVGTITQNTIALSWNALTDPSIPVTYKLYKNGTYTGTPITGTSTVSSGLTIGTTYSFTLSACDALGNCTAQSAAATATTLAAPGAPTGVTVTNPTLSSLQVNWSAPVPNTAISYRIYRGIGLEAIDTVTPIATVSAPNLSYVDTGLNANMEYTYRVSAVNAVGESALAPSSTSGVMGTTSTPQITISSLELVQATGGTVISSLTAGQTINVGTQAGVGTNISVKANTNPAVAGSVVFSLQKPNGQVHTLTENTSPYTMFGDTSATTFVPWQDLQIGGYTLTVTPYAGAGATGQVGVPQTLQFQVVNNDDVTPPANPTNTSFTYRSASEIRLTWINSVSPDTSSYRVYRDGTSIGVVNYPTSTYTDATANGTASYVYKVTAIDASNNEAALPSAGATAPTLSTNFTINNQVVTTSSVSLRSVPELTGTTGTQASGATGIIIGGPVWIVGGTQYWNVNFNSGADGWVSQGSLDIYVPNPPVITVKDISGDTNWVLPSGTTQTTLTITTDVASTCKWSTVSTDTYSQMPSANTFTGSGTSHTYAFLGLTDGTSYTRYVRCSDALGNAMTTSGTNGTVSFSVAMPAITVTITSPTSPTEGQVLGAGTTTATLSITTNQAATCKWSTVSTDTYSQMPNTFTVLNSPTSTSHNYPLIGLTNGTSYTRYMACSPTAGGSASVTQSRTFSVATGSTEPVVTTTCPTMPTLSSNLGTKAGVSLCAAVSNNPNSITLYWSPVTGSTTSSITISRKSGYTSTSWTQVATPASTATSWTDTTAVSGQYYEYKVTMGRSTGTAYGYIASGINVPLEASKGKIVLVVDNTFQTSLATQIQALVDDLTADRWVVAPVQYVSRTATPASVRSLIKTIYDADPTNTKAVYLLGHVPVASLGNMSPDGHGSGRGMSGDGYYGEMTSTWNNVAGGCTPYTWDPLVSNNLEVPSNDARFCHSSLPSDAELQVGRVDMFRVTAFGGTETSLLTTYLNKVRNFKSRQFVPQERALVRDIFGTYGTNNSVAQIAWSALPGVVGAQNITNNSTYTSIAPLINNQSYLWVHANGWGASTQGSDADVAGSTAVAAANSWGGVFNMVWGSYFGEWNDQNAYLKSLLASGNAMVSMYSAPKLPYFHSMGMGQNVGYGFRLSLNNSSSNLYTPTSNATTSGNGYMTMFGDPTLRARYVAPASNLSVTSSGGMSSLSWSASSGATSGYNVYKVTASAITRLNSSPISGTSYVSTDTYSAGNKYMVTALKLESTPSGTYYNESLGSTATIAGGGDTTAPTVPGGLALVNTTTSSISFSWTASTDAVGVTGYKVFRNGTQVGTSATASYTDTGLNANTSYSYTVSSYDAAGNNSAQSTALALATPSGQQASAVTGLNGAVGPNTTENATSCTNPTGQTVYYVDGTSGVDTNNGTSVATAWKSISKVNSSMSSMSAGAMICFKRGNTYRGTITIGRSGTSSSPMRISAYGTGSAPIISGLDAVTGTWSVYSGNIYKTTIATGLTPKQLRVGGTMQKLARTPNTGWLGTDSMTATTITDSWIGTQAANSLVGSSLIVRSKPWSWYEQTISAQSGSTVTFPTAGTYSSVAGWSYGFENKLSFLDSAGEWYYNSSTGELYLWAPGSVNPSTLSVEISARNSGVFFTYGRTDVQIKNLAFEGFSGPITGISGDGNLKRVVLENLEMSDSDKAIYMWTESNPSSDANTIQNNYIHDIFSDAVTIMGGSGHSLIGNVIENIGLDPWLGANAGGWGLMGLYSATSNQVIKRNMMNNIGYIGMFVNGSGLIEENVIEGVTKITTDGAGIQFDAANGMTIRKNIVKDVYSDMTTMPLPYTGYQAIGNGLYYGWNDIQNTTLDANVVINAENAAIMMDHGIEYTNNSVTNNIGFNFGRAGIFLSDYSNYEDYGSAYTVCQTYASSQCYHSPYNDVVTGNKMYGLTTTAKPLYLYYVYSNGSGAKADYGTINNNYYYNPFTSTRIQTKLPLIPPNTVSNYTLAQWRSASGEDGNSTESAYASTRPPAEIFYNPTTSSITQSVNGCTATGTPLTGTQTIAPFSALVVEYGNC